MNSVSCATAGNCTAGGDYGDYSGNFHAFFIDETNGNWGNTIEVPGTATLNSGGDAEVNSVSCATAGDCAAGGHYKDASGNYQAFVVDKTNGSWGNTIEVPGTATLNSGGDARVDSVSCATAGNCAAGGYYSVGFDQNEEILRAFVVDETNGSWGSAIAVPGIATFNSGGDARVNSVSCATPSYCAAVGTYPDRYSIPRPFVVSYRKPHSLNPGGTTSP